MSVNQLSEQQKLAAVKQLVNSATFKAANPHLSSDQLKRLQDSLDWPSQKPVYSPYAKTHDGYSQSKSKISLLTQTLADTTSSIQWYEVPMPPPHICSMDWGCAWDRGRDLSCNVSRQQDH